jgi:hypothetical protein
MRLCECNTVNACNVPRTTRAGSGAAKGSGSRFLYLVYSAWDVFDTEQVGKAGTRTGSTEFNFFSMRGHDTAGQVSVRARLEKLGGIGVLMRMWICGFVDLCMCV